MCWWRAMATGSWDTGPFQLLGVASIWSGSGSVNAPLARWTEDAVSVAFPAVETTAAVVAALYVVSTPGVNAPNVAGGPSVRASVAGTVPPTPPSTVGNSSTWTRADDRASLISTPPNGAPVN